MLRKLALIAALALLPGLAAANDKLSVILEWYVNPDHAPMVIAEANGYFADEGLDVDLVPPADPSMVPRMVASGRSDIGVHYQPNLYLDHAAGIDIKRFGTLVSTPLNTLTVMADGPVQSLGDLKGRKIGFSVAGIEEAVVSAMLSSTGLTRDDITLVNVNFALTQSLLSGQVDATIGAFRNFELTQMAIEGEEGRAFYPEENGVPVYDELIYVTRSELLGDDRLPRFLDAVERATIFITNHPQEAWALFAKAYPDLDDELNRKAFADTIARFAKSPAAFDAGRYRRFGAFMAENGLIDAAPDVSEISVSLQGE
ncbi:ABC transporter substrate-binding protein [Martelella radicis]|uniref:Putative hydroxymethylpyrimidine transport system substrate-binding protein n=1 Tax=Martelella radicis TaxID=1397476 RepID=A0A7W6PAX5_9HYPH|nr:ABC transporter substrate-binding protein [Martelella radicis]MBB4122861.1 putative hydroxymethylpyrimidine transport system substrate-binding protein [Martelella radicis]